MSEIAEQLHADNTILKNENMELKELINTRKKRASGKRIIFKGVKVVIMEYISGVEKGRDNIQREEERVQKEEKATGN